MHITKNEENFKRLRTILHEGEYSLNQRTKTRGVFDEEECRPFINLTSARMSKTLHCFLSI
jgi:uncharacterized protein YfbU (UPF0304 family)